MKWSTLAQAGRVVWHGLTDLVYPPSCLACRRPLAATAERDDSPLSSFCITCADSIRGDDQPVCPRCAANVGLYSFVDEGCNYCRKERLAFDAAYRLGKYRPPLRELVLRLKSARSESLAEHLGELLAVERRDSLTACAADLLVPVPLHWWRRLRRGYNQSEAIARGMARRLNIPLVPGCLRKIRHTPSQVSLSGLDRKKNVRGAFRANGNLVTGRTILLIDDVMTSTATLQESARTLRDAGAACVVVAVLARTGID